MPSHEKRVRIEDKWWAKLHFKLLGFWPESVLVERIRTTREHAMAQIEELLERKRCPRCGGVMCAEMDHDGPYMFCVDCGLGGHD